MMERILKLLFFAGILFLVFLAGIVAAIEKTYFYRKVQEVYLYRQARNEELLIQKNHPSGSDDVLFQKARNAAKGVTHYNPEKSLKGYSFYTDVTSSAYLIDMDGRVVHQWHFPYEQAFPERPLDTHYVTWNGTHLMPDGSLLALYMNFDHTPYGAGLIKLDKDSRLLWKYPENTHHAIDVAPDGKIYVLILTIDRDSFPGIPIMHDWIAVLGPDGKEIKRISILNALHNSEFSHLMDKLPLAKGDVTHTNSIRYITLELAKVFPFAKAGDLLINIRNMSAIAVVDPGQEKIIWLKKGVWTQEHDVSLLPDGHIMLFDNYGKSGTITADSSRALEYDPVKDAVTWSYEGAKESPLSSWMMGNVQQLKNGNVLITEGLQGRLVEVTREGEIVWEYYTPVRAGKDNELISSVIDGKRYDIHDLPFLEGH